MCEICPSRCPPVSLLVFHLLWSTGEPVVHRCRLARASTCRTISGSPHRWGTGRGDIADAPFCTNSLVADLTRESGWLCSCVTRCSDTFRRRN